MEHYKRMAEKLPFISHFILADHQDIARAGMKFTISQHEGWTYEEVDDKGELLKALTQAEESIVILDYTTFDINGMDELAVLCERYPVTWWLLFCDELSRDFLRSIIASNIQIGILLKDASMPEIKEALRRLSERHRYICQRTMEVMLMPEMQNEEKNVLTKTEVEILKDITLGMTTKEIAEKRFSSFHTVNTHRKNIFRKLKVNNVHEATKYALRAGLVDAAEYYI